MQLSLPARAVALLAAAAIAGPLSGCSAVNPLAGARSGEADTWTRASPRAAVVTRRPPRRRPPPPPPPPAARIVEPGPAVRVDEPMFLGVASPSSSAVAATIRERGEAWLGVRYRFGGESRSGIDCSAFTRQIFREAFGMELPRNTALQVQEGRPVSKEDLAPGDLVFFRRGGTRHVGVYLGGNEFLHASTRLGVTISNLDEDYYTRHYWTARRILTGPPAYAASEVRRRPLPRAEREARRAEVDTARVVPVRPARERVVAQPDDPARDGW